MVLVGQPVRAEVVPALPAADLVSQDRALAAGTLVVPEERAVQWVPDQEVPWAQAPDQWVPGLADLDLDRQGTWAARLAAASWAVLWALALEEWVLTHTI